MAKKTYPSGVITPELGSTNWYSDYDTNSSLLDSNITKTNSLDSKVKELETNYTNVETSLTSLSAVAKSGDYNDLSNKPESIALAEKAVADGDNNVITNTYATKKEVVTSLEPYIKKTELADVATSGSYTDLSDKPTTIAHADRATADNNGDVITETYAKKTEIPNLDGYALSKDISKVGKTNNYKDLDNLPTIPSLDGYVTNVELSPVAKSGDYNDLSNTPEPVDLTPYATKEELGSKAEDANVVHKSGAETIVGTKTYTNQMYLGTGGTGYGQISAYDTNSILRLYGGTLPDNGANLDLYGENLSDGGFALRARTTDKIVTLEGRTNGVLTWDNNEILTRVNGVTIDTAQTISGNKTFTDQITFQDHFLRIINTKVDLLHGTDSSWAGTGITGVDKNNVRIGFFDFFVGTNGCAFKLFCRNKQDVEKEIFYAGIDTNGVYGVLDGKNIVRTVNGVVADQAGNVNLTNILTDENQIMVLKNLTGAKINSGAVIDCGTGNGMLVAWYMNTAGSWVLADNKPTGKWKNANKYSLLAEESGIFVMVG